VATDTDGTISEVQFFVDEIKVGTVTSSPYNYEWNTSGESLGNHILKATCFDNKNLSASDKIDV
jgi:chitinase